MPDRAKAAYKRVLLKISGEGFRGAGEFGISPAELGVIAEEIAAVRRLGVAAAVVIGGGNFLRGEQASAEGPITRGTADYMGMLATMLNGLALQDALEAKSIETRMLSAIRVEEICEPYIRRKAASHLDKGRVVLLAGGTGNPHFTTDTAAALRAAELGCEVLLKATKVDGVYSADPMADKKARRYDHLSYMDVLQGQLKVMDATAISLCMDNDLPIVVFSLRKRGNIVKAVRGGKIGTLVDGRKGRR